MSNKHTDKKRGRLSLRELISSVFAAAIGVQSDDNRARDFAQGSARQTIIAGLIATVLFVLLIYGGVQLIVHIAAG